MKAARNYSGKNYEIPTLVESPSKKTGRDAILTLTIDSAEGHETHIFRVTNIIGNTLAWQRKGKALEESLSKAFAGIFGSNVRLEK